MTRFLHAAVAPGHSARFLVAGQTGDMGNRCAELACRVNIVDPSSHYLDERPGFISRRAMLPPEGPVITERIRRLPVRWRATDAGERARIWTRTALMIWRKNSHHPAPGAASCDYSP